MSILNAPGAQLPLIGAAQFSFDPKPPVPQIMTMLDNCGAQIVRFEVPWSDTELQPGQYAVPSYQGWLLAEALHSGRQVVIVLDYGNPLYPGSGAFNMPPRDAASCSAFANYAAWLVSQYAAPNVWFEIYNEPNNPTFWANAVNASQYAALLSACIPAMRAVPGVGAKANIITAGVGSVASLNDQNPYMNAVATAVGPSLMSQLTAQTLHPYDANDPPEAIFSAISGYQSAVPCTVPIAVTESGYTSIWIGSDENKRALYVARMIGSAVLSGLNMLAIFSLHDTGNDPNNVQFNFGLHSFAHVPKSAAVAMKAMINALKGTLTYDAETLSNPTGNVYRITLRKAGGVITKIVWTDQLSTGYVEPMSSVQSMVDVTGFQPWHRLMPNGVAFTLGSAVAPIIITGT